MIVSKAVLTIPEHIDEISHVIKSTNEQFVPLILYLIIKDGSLNDKIIILQYQKRHDWLLYWSYNEREGYKNNS